MSTSFEQRLDAVLEVSNDDLILAEGITDILNWMKGGDPDEVVKDGMTRRELGELKLVQKQIPKLHKVVQWQKFSKMLKTPKAQEILEKEFQNWQYKGGSQKFRKLYDKDKQRLQPYYHIPGGGMSSAITDPGRTGTWTGHPESKKPKLNALNENHWPEIVSRMIVD